MSNTINIIAQRKGEGPTQIEHPITKELLTGTPVPGTTDQDQVSFDVDIEIPTPFTFTAVLGGKRFEFPKDVLYPGAFRYDVPEGSKYSSAGVFDGDKLVRLLWGNRPEAPGNGKLGKWDGRLDNLQRAPGGSYQIRVLTHGITFDWEGPAYNTSWPAQNLGTMQRGYRFIRGIVQSANKDLHLVKDYTEAESFAVVLNPSDLDNRIELFPRFGVGTTSEFNATDGNGVYLTRLNRDKGNETIMPSWATGYSATTRKFLSFSSGTSYAPDPNHPEQAEGAINFLNPGDTSNIPTGIAVQRSGNLLFLPYSGNKVTVAHKLTGAVLGSTTINTVSSGTVDGNDAPWFITAGAVKQYSANATTGALTSSSVALPGLVDPKAISAYGDLMGVLDGGASQQRKFYRLSTRELIYTSPIAGGYMVNPNADPNRHYFSDVSGSAERPSISLLQDGSYWVVEPPLCRAQHFAADHSLIESITYIDNAYRLAMSQSNSQELFIKGLEFKVIEAVGKSWSESLVLVRVWRATMPAQFFKLDNPKQNIEVSEFGQVSTLSNGRRYVWLKERESSKHCELELTETGVRLTPNFDTIPVTMGADGSLYYASFINDKKDYERRVRRITGFDASGNPQRAAAVRNHLIPNIGTQAPVDYSGYESTTAFVQTDSGKPVYFYGGLMRLLEGKEYGYGYHLGIGNGNGLGFSALTAFATAGAAYRGPYPTDGSYEVGNRGDYKVGQQKGYAASSVRAVGEFIYTNDPGEFWGPKSRQLCKHLLYYSNGLPVLVWGPTYEDADNSPTGYFPGMTGGTQMGEIKFSTIDPTRAYLYTIGEGAFGGPERWRLENMDSVVTKVAATVTVAAATQYTRLLASTTTDLLAAVPARSNFQAGVPGFVQTPLTEDLSAEFAGSYWGVRTSIRKYDRFASPDVYLFFRQQNKTNTFRFPACLPPSTKSVSWELRATLNFSNNNFNDGELKDTSNSGGLYYDLLDQSDKELVRLRLKANYGVSPAQGSILLNDKVVATGSLFDVIGPLVSTDQDLVLAITDGIVTAQYGDSQPVTLTAFTAGADFTAPGSVLVTFWDKGVSRDRCVDISRLWFTLGKPTPQPVGTDARVAPDPATGPPNGVNWQEPITLLSEMRDADGVIRPKGHFRSTSPNIAAITANCGSTPIDITQMFVAHAGRGFSGGTGTNVRMRDTGFYGLNTTVDNKVRERGIHISKGTNVDLQYITLETSGGIYCEEWVGNHTPSQSLKIQNVKSRNIIGSDGTGPDGHGGYRSIVQLKDIRTKGMRLAYIEGYNEADKSRIEDTFNLFRSGGLDADNPLLGYGLLGYGSYPFPATATLYTGAVFSADGGYDTSRGEMPPAFILLDELFGISNCNAVGNIAVGHDIAYRNIRAVTSGYLPDGRMLRSSFKAFSINNFYEGAPGYNNTISGITSLFYRTKDVYRRADFVADVNYDPTPDPGIDVAHAILPPDVTSAADGLAREADEWRRWVAFLNKNKQTCGSRYKPLAS